MTNTTICTGLLLTGIALAVASDVSRRRIPNAVTAIVAVAALATAGFARGPLAILEGAALVAAVLAVGSFAFALRWLGGGDVKLIAALSASLVPVDVLFFSLFTAVCGGLVAAAYAALRGRLGATIASVARSATSSLQLRRHVAPQTAGLRVPYALAIAGGYVLTLTLAAHGSLDPLRFVR